MFVRRFQQGQCIRKPQPPQSPRRSPRSSRRRSRPVAPCRARRNGPGEALDSAKVTTFVAAFKATDLGTDLSDADIEAILSDTCDDLSGGMNDDEAKGALSERITTANNGNSPSNMQLEAIFAAAKVAC